MFRQKVAIALAAVTAALSISQRTEATPAALVPAVATCMSTPQCVVAVVTVGGVVYWQVKHALENPILIPMPVLDDPENPTEQPQIWDEPILAGSSAEAERICRQRAAKYGVELNKVQQPSRVKEGQNQQYRCWFRG
ncbi:hypothetical protein NDA01_30880 [Trichocoleus desertorum AS-A10]|uniref:hypothetical protein n=1 Tax=Trichocoleus desertorum TaxID=1481672 RepID=UPI00329711BE